VGELICGENFIRGKMFRVFLEKKNPRNFTAERRSVGESTDLWAFDVKKKAIVKVEAPLGNNNSFYCFRFSKRTSQRMSVDDSDERCT
jgi:hypothetical protein